MVERGHRPRLLIESPEAIRIGLEFLREQLHRDFTVEARIVGPIHLTHGAATKLGEEAIRSQRLAHGEAHMTVRDNEGFWGLVSSRLTTRAALRQPQIAAP